MAKVNMAWNVGAPIQIIIISQCVVCLLLLLYEIVQFECAIDADS